MDCSRFLNEIQEKDLIHGLRKTHIASTKCNGALSLASGMPNPGTLPITGLSFCYPDGTQFDVTEDEMHNAMKYQSAVGLPRLLKWIEVIQRKYHSPPTVGHADTNVRFATCVTSGGAIGAIYTLLSQVLEKDGLVLLGDHIFSGVKCCCKRLGATMLGIEMDDQGITPESLRFNLKHWKEITLAIDCTKSFRSPKILYVNPTGQNPTGVVASLHRKKKIYKIAQEYNLLIVEDDPYFYIQYTKEMVQSYQSIDTDGRVVRIDSVSKLLAPGFRLGWLSGPNAIVKRIGQAQVSSSGFPGGFAQLATLKLFDQWRDEGISKRIEYLKNFYKPLKEEAERVVQKYLADLVEWYPAKAGFFLWLKLKNGMDTSTLMDMTSFRKHKIFAVPGDDFSSTDKSGPYLRIAFSCLQPEEFEEAVSRLAKLIREAGNNNYQMVAKQNI